MKWQEYEEAVGQLYEHLAAQGSVRRNVRLPDRVTGGLRQVDVWWEVELSGHRLGVLIDAKLRRGRVDVKDVEEVLALGGAVGAQKCVIVTVEGWTESAEKKAVLAGLDLRILSIQDAFEVLDIEAWRFCPVCESDCILLDAENAIDLGRVWFWWLAGHCRSCRAADVWCQECGQRYMVPLGDTVACHCGHRWKNADSGLLLAFNGQPTWVQLSLSPDAESAGLQPPQSRK